MRREKIDFVKGDIGNRELVEDIFFRYDIDYVVNFAAEDDHVDRSISGPRVFLETNILGTQNLLEVAKNNWSIGKDEKGYPIYKEGKKYLQISTDEVYGSLNKSYLETRELHLGENIKKVVEGREKSKNLWGKLFYRRNSIRYKITIFIFKSFSRYDSKSLC